MGNPEQEARQQIDALLDKAGWHICDADAANIHAARGVAIREFPLPGHGFADYLLYVDGKAAGVIEAKKQGVTLSGVETQADKYTKGLPAGLPRWHNPLPFSYQSTGEETRFTNGLDPEPRSRPVFAFHKPEILAEWLSDTSPLPAGDAGMDAGGRATQGAVAEGQGEGTFNVAWAARSDAQEAVAEATPIYTAKPQTFLARMQHMPPLPEAGLWPAQITAITNLEQSLRENRPRALIQMATGSGKTFTAISFLYRLIKFAGARRILFLVDRGNLADQTLKEFQQYASPYNNFKFTEEYIVQRLQGNTLDTTARVCISTIQRMYSMLKGKDLPEDLEDISPDKLLLPSPAGGRGAGGEGNGGRAGSLFAQPDPQPHRRQSAHRTGRLRVCPVLAARRSRQGALIWVEPTSTKVQTKFLPRILEFFSKRIAWFSSGPGGAAFTSANYKMEDPLNGNVFDTGVEVQRFVRK